MNLGKNMTNNNKLAYLIGIKGVGMSALAIYLKQAGYEVTGSDSDEAYITDKILKENKISFFTEYNKENLKGLKPAVVVVSAAYGKENPEVKEAQKRHLNLKYYSEMLGEISSDKKVIAVGGVHGKTTITAMISFILEKANLSPSFIIGAGKVPSLKANAKKGDGDYFIIEADEYRKSPESKEPKFLDFLPFIEVISGIELDHPDIYDSLEDIYQAFYKFACHIPRNGFIVLCTDYPRCKKIRSSIADRNFETYGYENGSKWKVVDVKEEGEYSEFSIDKNGEIIGPFKIKLPGKHNILNATAAIIISLKLDIPEETVKKYLFQFDGVERRFQKIFENEKIKIFDDYAHHPTAIKYTIEAAKKRFPNSKIWVAFQPHTYSRTEKLMADFGNAFRLADKVIITDIYASKREEKGKITSSDLVSEIKKHQSNVRFFPEKERVKNYIKDSLKENVVFITIGAGDIYKIGKELAAELGEK